MKPEWKWPLLVIAALTFTVGANVIMFITAGSDPNAAVVEPDYYRKAVEWDSTMARRLASDQLGWTAEVYLGVATEGVRPVSILLRDSEGAVVEGASVELTLIHNLEASRPVLAQLLPGEGDHYLGSAVASRGGLWEIRVDARRGDDRFLQILHVEAP